MKQCLSCGERCNTQCDLCGQPFCKTCMEEYPKGIIVCDECFDKVTDRELERKGLI